MQTPQKSKLVMLLPVFIIIIVAMGMIPGVSAAVNEFKPLALPSDQPVILSIQHSREISGWTPLLIRIGNITVIKWMVKDGIVADEHEYDEDKAIPLFKIILNKQQIKTATQTIPFIILERNRFETRIKIDEKDIPTWIGIQEKNHLGEILIFEDQMRLASFHIQRREMTPAMDRVELWGTDILEDGNYWYNKKSKKILPSVKLNSYEYDLPNLERQALIALYNNTNGSGWSNNNGWKEPPLHSDGFSLPGTEGNWYGIIVNGGYVTHIELNNNNLSGSIPTELKNLSHLSYLHLNWNHLTGSIPTQLSDLPNLESLDLSWNSFASGPIPDLQASNTLRILNLYNTNRTGMIPLWISNLTELHTLVLSTNQLSGGIPSGLGNLSKMKYLDISANSFDPGPIPEWIQNMSLLSRLRLFMTNRTGNIPAWIGNLTDLTYLNLGNNEGMQGTIPSELGNLINLDTLQIRSLKLSGTIPATLGKLINLTRLYLDYNQLSGSIPPELGQLTKLQRLYLSSNHLEGILPAELSNLTKLQYLYLGWNSFSPGPIPEFIKDLSSLTRLDLESTKRTDIIPSWIGNLGNLQELQLNLNQLSGSLPNSIGNLVNLQSLNISANKLKGILPIRLLDLNHLNNNGGLDIRWNSLYTYNNALKNFLNTKHTAGIDNWESTQTVAPTNISAVTGSTSSINVSWTPIKYKDGTGGYMVDYSSSPEGPWTCSGITSNKSASSFLVTGLTPATMYYFKVKTQSDPNANNFNTVISDFSEEVSTVTESAINHFTLTVDSSPAMGINITVTPLDNNNNGNGTTQFSRIYNEGTSITLTAPSTHDGKEFSHWTLNNNVEASKDNVKSNINQSFQISVEMNGNKRAKVYYVTPQPPVIYLNRSILNFGYSIGSNLPVEQTITISNTGGGTLNWTAESTANWINLTPLSGSGSGIIHVSINPNGLSTGTYQGSITISDSNAATPQKWIAVKLVVKDATQDLPPLGNFDTPLDGMNVSGSIPISGWALDDTGLENVIIYRDPIIGEGSNRIYIGNGIMVDGARPDIEESYPEFPQNYQAGWGYMMLTYGLPNMGNGTFKLYAIAKDTSGHEITLGTKTIFCDNENAVKPFGTIDIPAQGGSASGSDYIHWGWALTPQPNTIPINGSTINIYVDGVFIGHPTYNMPRQDIAGLFPSYANSGGPAGYSKLDTTTYTNGIHSIYWTATDDAGNCDGIGSRYFTIQNTHTEKPPKSSQKFSGLPLSKTPIDCLNPIKLKTRHGEYIKIQDIYPSDNGTIIIKTRPLKPFEIRLGITDQHNHLSSSPNVIGYMVVAGQYKPLPIGATLNIEKSTFYWQPGPGFVGIYHFYFFQYSRSNKIRKVKIKIIIK